MAPCHPWMGDWEAHNQGWSSDWGTAVVEGSWGLRCVLGVVGREIRRLTRRLGARWLTDREIIQAS